MRARAALAVLLAAVVVIASAQPEACVSHEVVPIVPSPTVAPVPGPTEVVVPVEVAFPVPTAVSGAALNWPRLHLGETGEISHYGDICPTCVALPFPWGAGWRVSIAGPGGTWHGVSNDMGPVRSLHRIADLGRPIWERVCGVPASYGICTATVTVTGVAK